MLHFDEIFFIFIAIFIDKIGKICYNFLVFRRFSAGVAWESVVSAVQCLVMTF